MANDLMNIEAFKNARPAAAFMQRPLNESLADGIGASYGVLSYRGKSWSLRYRGENHMLLRPDDGTPMGYIDVIIVRQARSKSKSYYPQGTYDPNNPSNERPMCASLDGIKPDADARQPQAVACTVCPHNEFKQLPDGKKRRDCSDYKRMAVLLMPAVAKLMLNGETLNEPVFLRVPPASLNDLASYGAMLDGQGFPYNSVVTRIKFDAKEAHPKMIFTAQRPLSDEDAKFILPLFDEPHTIRIIGEGAPYVAGRPAITGGVSNVIPMQQVQQVQQVQPKQEILPPVSPPPPPPAPPKEFELDDGGSVVSALAASGQGAVVERIAGAPAAALINTAVMPPTQNTEDTGLGFADADPALNDKIAALLQTK